jgi:hypothetical protein
LVNLGDKGRLRIVLGYGENTSKILSAVASLVNNYTGGIDIDIEVDFQPQDLLPPVFSNIKKRKWLALIQNRPADKLPRIAVELQKRVGSEAFRWYRNVTKGDWSGRVDGLEVCRVGNNADFGVLNVGSIGKKGNIGKPRKFFLEITQGREGHFDLTRINEVVQVIKEVAKSRANGKLSKVQEEHLLESQILRGAIAVNVGSPLKPVVTDYPFQFPTLWTSEGSARFLDVLMRKNDVPYAVELKVPSQGGGEKYRHAISQAVLYREFIRRADQLHPWFEKNGLDAKRCEAVVAFPKMKPNQKNILSQHRAVADFFRVRIVELDL